MDVAPDSREQFVDRAVSTRVETIRNDKARLAALRVSWGVMLAGIVASCVWLVLEVLAGWESYGSVVGPILHGQSFTHPSFDGSDPPIVFSAPPSYSLVGAVAIVACASVVALRASHAGSFRRSAAYRLAYAAGDDYRTAVAQVADPERARRAATRLFLIHASLVAVAALVLVGFAVWRMPPGPYSPRGWGADGSSRIEIAAIRFAAMVDAWSLSAIAAALLLAVFPTRRRLEG